MISDKKKLQSFATLEQDAQAILADSFSDPEYPNILLVDGNKVSSWGKNVIKLLEGVFGKDSAQYQTFTQKFRGEIYSNTFKTYLSIFKSIYEQYENSLIKASTVENVLAQAKMLLSTGEKGPACMMTGVALETALRELCQRHANLPADECNQGSDQVNLSLYKAGVYGRLTLNQISSWLEMQKKASRGAWDEFTPKDVLKMFQGVARFVADYLH